MWSLPFAPSVAAISILITSNRPCFLPTLKRTLGCILIWNWDIPFNQVSYTYNREHFFLVLR